MASAHRSVVSHESLTDVFRPFLVDANGEAVVRLQLAFEVVIYELFNKLGWLGVLLYTYVMLLGITWALHSLIRKFEKRLAQSVALTALAMIGMSRVCSPRPWLFTILFVCIQLNILVEVRRTREFNLLFGCFRFSLCGRTHTFSLFTDSSY